MEISLFKKKNPFCDDRSDLQMNNLGLEKVSSDASTNSQENATKVEAKNALSDTINCKNTTSPKTNSHEHGVSPDTTGPHKRHAPKPPHTSPAQQCESTEPELWLGDIPSGYSVKKLGQVLYTALPAGMELPHVKRLVRKGYKRRKKDRSGGRGKYLGFAILRFRDK